MKSEQMHVSEHDNGGYLSGLIVVAVTLFVFGFLIGLTI